MKYLLDASFVAKALLSEDEVVEDRLKGLLNDAQTGKIELISTKLLLLEVANTFRFSIKDIVECQSLFKDFLSLPIKTYALSKNQAHYVLKLSYEIDTTVYDTSYHVLAKAHNATFLTCDEKYYKKGRILGDIELIK